MSYWLVHVIGNVYSKVAIRLVEVVVSFNNVMDGDSLVPSEWCPRVYSEMIDESEGIIIEYVLFISLLFKPNAVNPLYVREDWMMIFSLLSKVRDKDKCKS